MCPMRVIRAVRRLTSVRRSIVHKKDLTTCGGVRFGDDKRQMDGVERPTTAQATMGWRGWLEMYCAELEANGSAQHASLHRNRVRFLMHHLRLESFDDITPRHAAIWLAYLRDHGQVRTDGRQRKAGPKTLKTHRSCMASMWKWLVQVEAVVPRPCPFSGVRVAPTTEAVMRALTTAEVGKLIHAAVRDETRLHERTYADGSPIIRSTLYWAMASTGIRLSEAQRVRWADVAFQAVPPELNITRHRGKRKREKAYTITADLAWAFEAHHRAAAPDDRHEPVWPFLTDRSKPSTIRLLRSDCRVACVDEVDRHGRRVGWHSFRHHTVSELLQSGVDVATVQGIMGHKDIRTTMKYFDRLNNRKSQDAQVSHCERVGDSVPGRVTGKSGKEVESGDGKAEDVDATSSTRYNERGPPQPSQDVAIKGGARFRSLGAGVDPVRPPQASRAPSSRNRFESCYAHLETAAAIARHSAQIAASAAALAQACSELIGSAPGKGTGRDAGSGSAGTDDRGQAGDPQRR